MGVGMVNVPVSARGDDSRWAVFPRGGEVDGGSGGGSGAGDRDDVRARRPGGPRVLPGIPGRLVGFETTGSGWDDDDRLRWPTSPRQTQSCARAGDAAPFTVPGGRTCCWAVASPFRYPRNVRPRCGRTHLVGAPLAAPFHLPCVSMENSGEFQLRRNQSRWDAGRLVGPFAAPFPRTRCPSVNDPSGHRARRAAPLRMCCHLVITGPGTS